MSHFTKQDWTRATENQKEAKHGRTNEGPRNLTDVELELVNGGKQGGFAAGPGGFLAGWSK